MKVGKANILSEGQDIGIICNSSLALEQGLKVTVMLEKLGYSVRLIDMFTLAPLDVEEIIKTAKTCTTLLTIENSMLKNGLCSMVTNTLFSQHIDTNLISFGIPHIYGEVGSKEYLLHKYGMDADSIFQKIQKEI